MKILVALSRFPYPTDKGDKLRAYYQLRSLAVSHEIYLVCLSSEKINESDKAEVRKFCRELHIIRLPWLARIFNLLLALFSAIPFQVYYFRSPAMRKLIREISCEKGIDICYTQLIRLALNLPRSENMICYLDFMDSFSKGMTRRLTASRWFEKPLVAWEAKRLRKFENETAREFQGFSIISESDKEEFLPSVREKMDVIPNGVNEAFFECEAASEKDFEIIFTGNMGYHPNVQACKFLIREVKPLLNGKGLAVKICLAGTNPSREVLSLASSDVLVTGFVKDIRSFLSRSGIFVAPLFTGSGLQNKLLESMAAGLPTVTTSFTNKALGASHRENIFLCDSAAEFADTVYELLKNPHIGASVAAKGREFIRERYDWNTCNRKLEAVLERCVQKTGREVCQEEKLNLIR